MTATASRPDRALAAIMDGVRTSVEIATALDIPTRAAGEALKRLCREGAIRWTGHTVPRQGRRGRPLHLWEVAQ